MNNCPLCNGNAVVFCEKPNHLFYKCAICEGIFRPKFTHLNSIAEKAHYEKHNNDVNDIGYQNFVFPVVKVVLEHFSIDDKGLDFGSGTGPVIAKLLREQEYQIENYDLYFENKPNLLQQKYNYITCCEVMEHFKEPLKEFQQLQKMLQPNGKLICKTEMYNNQVPFENWYYKNDVTHVFIYQLATLHWIQKNLSFNKVKVLDKVVVFDV